MSALTTIVKHKFFTSYTAFIEKYDAGQILHTDICFICDTRQIWTHGYFFKCFDIDTYDFDNVIVELSGQVVEQLTNSIYGEIQDHIENDSVHVTAADKSEWAAKYDKPIGGIPLSDMDSNVQESLALADTALQEHQALKTINGNALIGTGNIGVGTVTSIGITGGSGISVSDSPVTTSGNITVDVSTAIAGSTTVTSIAAIPVTHRAVLATISASGTLSFADLPTDGYEVHVVIRNSGSSVISITLPSSGNYICTSEPIIYIAAGKYGEVNVLNIGGTGYIHGINSI